LRRIGKIVPTILFACALAAQSLPIQLRRDYLIVAKCSVADTPGFTAVIDTGVSETVIDIALARRLGLQTHTDRATFVSGESTVQAVSIPSVRLGPVRADSLAGIAVDLSRLDRDFGIHPDLLIGMDLLRGANFTIDYKSHVLTFGRISALTHAIPLAQDSRLPLIVSKVSGRNIRLQIDTGLNGLVLYADRFGFGQTLHELGAHLAGLSQAISVQDADVDLQLGDWLERHITASVIPNVSAITEFDGLLGARAFAKHRLAFDFERMIVAWD